MGMTYIKQNNGEITEVACGKDVDWFIDQGFEVTEKQIVTGYDGKMYFKDRCPKVPRLIQIENELMEADRAFNASSQQPIEFENHFYKFEWTGLYQSILGLGTTNYPVKIWDVSGFEENAVIMTKDKLQSLQNLLVSHQEPAFQLRKVTQSRLLKEKIELSQN